MFQESRTAIPQTTQLKQLPLTTHTQAPEHSVDTVDGKGSPYSFSSGRMTGQTVDPLQKGFSVDWTLLLFLGNTITSHVP